MNFENWHDPDDDFDPANDQHPERNELDLPRLAAVLGLSDRQVGRLARDGVLRRLPNGNFQRVDAVERYVTFKQRPRATDGLREKQAALLQQRLDRQAAELITMDDALGTIDKITTAMIATILEVGKEANAQEICSIAANQFAARAADARQALQKGPSK